MSTIPLNQLEQKTNEDVKKENNKISYKDQFVKNILSWFKSEYFTWCDTPICKKCNIKAKQKVESSQQPTEEEAKFKASRTEVYQCTNCFDQVRFPRYNDPLILCKTRTGRCGEYANLFGGILSCLGYDVRLIYNFEDHVWNEYWSDHLQRVR